MARSLVTGASGFIGPRLVARLAERGEEVVCLVRPSSDRRRLSLAGVSFAEGSLTDEASLAAALDGVDRVYHLAGKTHAPKLADFMAVNEVGTESLCRAAARREAPPTVLLVSSLSAAGPSPADRPHDESNACLPISNYGRSKLAGEVAAGRWAGELPLSVVRPPVVFGPGDRDGLLMFKAIRRIGIHFVPQMRGLPLSLVGVDDLVEAIVAVAERGERLKKTATPGNQIGPEGLYYAADPSVSSYAEMGRMAAAAMGRKVWVICRRKYPLLLPAMVGDIRARLTGGAPLLGMDKLREASASGWVCDPSKIVQELDWSPRASLAEQYQETAEWYRQEGWL